MRWRNYWPELLLVTVLLSLKTIRWFHGTDASSPLRAGPGWTPQRKLAARERTRELWYHGFDNYMTFAFPLDELTPLSCSGQGPDWGNPANIASNDVAGNFSLTLIDVLDTLVVLDDRPAFEKAVRDIITWVSFDVNTRPQVFETTIRVLGGLLSGHLYASRKGHPFYLPWYRGELLELAHDLGERLLPAFATPTGLPYARINLRRGVLKGETRETCTAGAGSLILEFATLSRLTGDDRFEKAARRAFFGIWNRKSDIGLVGNTINIYTGAWTHPETTGIGAGIDSFYEYALKWYILSGEIEFLDVWDDAYAAVMRYARSKDGFWYKTVNMHSGDSAYTTVDSLSAFWPGLQVLAGDVENAIKLHMIYYNLWKQHSGLPEVYDTNFKLATSHQYPLRPEFIESTWYLYRATRDPFYLNVGELVLRDITARAKVDCGLTGIADLRTNKQDDRMESFALSETLKYLYLLFDEDNPINSDDSSYVFTTEGHILFLDQKHLSPVPPARRKMRNIETHQCPAYTPFSTARTSKKDLGLVRGVRSRPDVEYARYLVGVEPTLADSYHWEASGLSEQPRVDPFTYEFILSKDGQPVPEDLSPSLLKLGVLDDGFVVNNVTGIRTQIVQRLDGQGYDVRKLGHYAVRSGHIVYINDTELFAGSDRKNLAQEELTRRGKQIAVHIHTTTSHDVSKSTDATITGYTASFGADLSSKPSSILSPVPPMRQPGGVVIRYDSTNPLGCDEFDATYEGSILLVHRGSCTFLEKLIHARNALAAGIVVVSDDETGINPTANADEVAAAGNLDDVGVILLPKKMGDNLQELVLVSEKFSVKVMLSLDTPQLGHSDTGSEAGVEQEMDPDREDEDGEGESTEDAPRILYINNHPLINTRLLV